ncbi:GntR family transcriptional regulator [Phycisphaerales bacterium AB-hyl4]|uniref:GntR family transcriptional regulator n=1 Tax=Natronomicrosphaera hydrolytica TaxID=3242702 RepID=A0ABV4U873_9BACT
MSTARKVKRPNQREAAYQAIREALILQAVPAGEKLSEPAWSERLAVSRSAVREAFARLEAEGLIELAETAGYVVPTLTAEDVAEIVELRLALEAAAIDRLCTRGLNTPEALKELEDACDQQDAFLANGYRLGATEADRRFHQQLVALAGNRRLTAMYRRAPLPLIHRMLVGTQPLRPSDHSVDEHREILRCLREGDAQGARHLLRRHLLPKVPVSMR